jgi:hypothetical protein
MAMSEEYKNAIADYGASLITHIGLVDESGTELSGTGYARKAVTWTDAEDGVIRPTADITFDIPAGATVAGWRGFSASTEGTNYGGGDLLVEIFGGVGQYELLASGTGILHT